MSFTVLAHVSTQAQEAMRRAKFKFPGRQKIVVSRNWGFTAYSRDDYVQWKREGRIVKDGVNAKVRAPDIEVLTIWTMVQGEDRDPWVVWAGLCTA